MKLLFDVGEAFENRLRRDKSFIKNFGIAATPHSPVDSSKKVGWAASRAFSPYVYAVAGQIIPPLVNNTARANSIAIHLGGHAGEHAAGKNKSFTAF